MTKLNQLKLIIATAILFAACNINNARKSVDDPSVKEGKQLAAQYCQSCHLLPAPNWADANSWEKGILPMMGPRLGIFSHNGKRYPVNKYDLTAGMDFYPRSPVLSPEQWQKIIDYYVSVAPDEANTKQERSTPINTDLQQFELKETNFINPIPATSFVAINEKNKAAPFIISDAVGHLLFQFDANLQVKDSFKTKGPVVNMLIHDNELQLCDIGILNPDNGANGSIRSLFFGNNKIMQGQQENALIERLQRPVQALNIDLNGDGKPDYLVAEFGYLTGALSWYEFTGKKYERHVLKAVPGAIKMEVRDFNKDGLPDIMTLFAQGDESIYLFLNQGNGNFKEERILQFPPINGSSSFELADMNQDGLEDIVYTCGDNADYSLQLKPYHGMYIFLNEGNNHFSQKYFYPLNGCYKAIARDFDKDGDLDIATISYFADFENQPEEGFVYFENKGKLQFQPSTNKILEKGRWLTMEVGDYDQDGYLDLILGNFSVAPSFIKSKMDWKKGPPFLVLKNKGPYNK